VIADKEPDDDITLPRPDGTIIVGDTHGPDVLMQRQLLEF
jgi:hypothetical protein